MPHWGEFVSCRHRRETGTKPRGITTTSFRARSSAMLSTLSQPPSSCTSRATRASRPFPRSFFVPLYRVKRKKRGDRTRGCIDAAGPPPPSPPPPPPTSHLHLRHSTADDEDSAASAKSFEEVSRRSHVLANRGITIREKGRLERGDSSGLRHTVSSLPSASPPFSPLAAARPLRSFVLFGTADVSVNVSLNVSLNVSANVLRIGLREPRYTVLPRPPLGFLSILPRGRCAEDRRRMPMDEAHGGGMVSAILSSVVLLLLLGRAADAQ